MSVTNIIPAKFIPRGDVATLLAAGIIIAKVVTVGNYFEVPDLLLGAAIGLLFRCLTK